MLRLIRNMRYEYKARTSMMRAKDDLINMSKAMHKLNKKTAFCETCYHLELLIPNKFVNLHDVTKPYKRLHQMCTFDGLYHIARDIALNSRGRKHQ